MINIIYSAQKTDSEDIVIGFYIPKNPDQQDGIVTLEQTQMCEDTGHIDVYTITHKINIETLKVSFDNGKTFNTFDRTLDLIEMGYDYEIAMMNRPVMNSCI